MNFCLIVMFRLPEEEQKNGRKRSPKVFVEGHISHPSNF